MTIVVVTGIPGSGKTTLASQLGERVGLSVLSKDVIKEALMDALGSGSVEWASKLSRMAHRVMYQLVPRIQGNAILEAHFHRGTAEPELHALGLPLVQVYCSCPIDVAWGRYKRRRDDPDRHPGHRPEHQDESATLGWRTTTPHPLDLDAPLLMVDTSEKVDIAGVAEKLLHHLDSSPHRTINRHPG